MHTRTSIAALLALAALCAGCPDGKQPGTAAAPGPAPILPDYTTHGIVVVDPNPQRPNYWDFGRVPYGERPQHVFRLRNLEAQPVVVRDMQASCGCVQPALRSADGKQVYRGRIVPGVPPFTLAPGAEAELEIVMDTSFVERMNVDKLGTVRILCDSPSTPILGFEAHVVVVRDFRCVPALIDLGEIAQGWAKRGRGDVTTDVAGAQARILGLERVEGPFTAHVDQTSIGNETGWIVSVDAREDLPIGSVRGKLVLQTTGSDGSGRGRDFEIPIAGQVVPRIVARPSILRLVQGQSQAELRLECLAPGEKVALKAVEFEGPGPEIEVESTPDEKGAARSSGWRIVFKPKGTLPPGGFARRARLVLDDAEIPELIVPLAGDAR